ncbi:MAG: hypothetical protein JO102_02150, partial [Elusimicrobia bacterium]|nr:hypothetical protein [Elusimicrobiota bacterium]
MADLGVSVLHKPHGSSEPGRKHTIIADFEGTGQKAFPEAYRKYLLKILLTNYVSVFGVSMRDPDHSGMVRYIVSLIKDADATDETEFTKDQRDMIAEIRAMRDYVRGIPDGRGVHLFSHVGSWHKTPEDAYAASQRSAMEDFVKSGRAKVTLGDAAAAMAAVAGTFPPVVNAPAATDETGTAETPRTWKEKMMAFFADWRGRADDTDRRSWLYGALLAVQEADPSGRYERSVKAAGVYSDAALVDDGTGTGTKRPDLSGNGPLAVRLQAIAEQNGKSVAALQALLKAVREDTSGATTLPPTLKDLLKVVPVEDHPKVINGLYRLDYVFAERAAVYDAMRARGALEEWQYNFLMGALRRDQLDEEGAMQHFGRAATQTATYNVDRLVDMGAEGRRAFFANPQSRREFFRAWTEEHQRFMALTEQQRLYRVNTNLEEPDAWAMADSQLQMGKFEGVFKKALEEDSARATTEKVLTDPNDLRAGARMTASADQVVLWQNFYKNFFGILGFQRDNKLTSRGGVSNAKRDELLEYLKLPNDPGDLTQVRARVDADLPGVLESYFAALAAGNDAVSYQLSERLKTYTVGRYLAEMEKTGGLGGDFTLLLDVYVTLLESATINNSLADAGGYLREAEQLKVMLTLGEDHWVVRLLERSKKYYQLKLAATTLDTGKRTKVIDQILKDAPLVQRYEFAKDRSVWLMLKEVLAIANWLKLDYKLDDANKAAVIKPFADVMQWFGEMNRAELRNSAWSGLMHVFSDFFDFKLLDGFKTYDDILPAADGRPGFRDLVKKLYTPDRDEANLQKAVKSVTFTRPNSFVMRGFYYHLEAMYGDPASRADAAMKAEKNYQEAFKLDTDPERKTRHGLRLVQFYADMVTGGLAGSETDSYKAKARGVLDAIPSILAPVGRTINVNPVVGLQPTSDGRLPLKFARLNTVFPPAVAGAVVLTTPATKAWAEFFFGKNVSPGVLRLFTAVWEMFQFFLPGFHEAHFAPGGLEDTPVNRLIAADGIGVVRAVSTIALALGVGLPLLLHASPLAAIGIGLAAFALTNGIAHDLLNNRFRVAFANYSVTRALAARRAEAARTVAAGIPAGTRPSAAELNRRQGQELARILPALFPIVNLGVGERSRRNEALNAIAADIALGRRIDANLGMLSVLLQKRESDFVDAAAAVSARTDDSPAGTLAMQVFDGTEADLRTSYQTLLSGLRAEDSAVVYVRQENLTDALRGELEAQARAAGRNVSIEAYDPQSLDLEGRVLVENA